MSGVLSFDEAKEQLAEVIASRNALLVLGAGASIGSGAPSTSELVGRLSAAFPSAEVLPSSSLFNACREVEITPAYGRHELQAFISRELGSLSPADAYKHIPLVRWRALFTTNYDDLIERAYESPARVQTLQPVPEEYRAAFVARDNHVPLHYLMGSVRYTGTSPSAPVLTWMDYTRTLRNRAPVMQMLQNVLADGGKVVYVGYSFADMVFEAILDEALEQLGHRGVPYGFALIKEWPKDRRRGFQRIASLNVIPVDGTFEQFALLIDDLARGGSASQRSFLGGSTSPASGSTLTIGAQSIKLSESEAGVYSEAFEIVNDECLTESKIGPTARADLAKRFFRGEIDNWSAYRSDIPFRRAAYESLKSAVIERAAHRRLDDKIVLMHGPAAVGKSVMARQLALDLFANHELPVVIAKPSWRARPDSKLLDRLIDDLEGSLVEGKDLPPLILIIDEAELLDRAVPGRLAAYMRARHRNVVIVLLARTNEFFRLGSPGKGATIQPDWQYVAVTDRIGPDEVAQLVDHLVQTGIWDRKRISNKVFWQEQVEREWGGSFFETVYALITESQKPLREHVVSEFNQLSDHGKQAYLLIAALHQFGIPVKMEILMRALNLDFAGFESAIIQSDAKDVLISEHVGSDLNISYRARTRLISQIVFENELPTPGAQLPTFLRFVTSVKPSELLGTDELDALRTLLIQVLGPSGHDSRFSPDELAELYAAATETVEDDVLEHHFGIVEKDAGRLESAREHLERALLLSSTLPSDLAAIRESPQNIENTLAMVIGLMANNAIRRGDYPGAELLFSEAAAHFTRARAGSFPNAAAYDAHARMLYTRADKLFTKGSDNQITALIDVLDVLSEGLDNVNDDAKPILVELQADVLSAIGNRSEALRDLHDRAEKATPTAAARYEITMARLLINGDIRTAKRKHMHTALSYAVRATEHDPSYSAAWRMRAELHLSIYPQETRELITYLEAALRYGGTTDNYWVLYELAVACFEVEEYSRSAHTFGQLRRVSGGHNRGGAVVEVAGERSGQDPFSFDGRVTRGDARAPFVIQCDALAAFGSILFSQRERFYTPRVGDQVVFYIGFTYRGITAVEVKRV